MRYPLSISKTGLECAMESGGGMTNTGEATIIASPDGGKPQALTVFTGGHLSNSNHALIPVGVGCYVLMGGRSRSDLNMTIWRVDSLHNSGLIDPKDLPDGYIFHASFGDSRGKYFWAEMSCMNTFSNGEWDNTLPSHMVKPVAALIDKLSCYHCREPHYVLEGKVSSPLGEAITYPQLQGGWRGCSD